MMAEYYCVVNDDYDHTISEGYMSQDDIDYVEDVIFATIMADFYFSLLAVYVGHEILGLSKESSLLLLFIPTLVIIIGFILYVLWVWYHDQL